MFFRANIEMVKKESHQTHRIHNKIYMSEPQIMKFGNINDSQMSMSKAGVTGWITVSIPFPHKCQLKSHAALLAVILNLPPFSTSFTLCPHYTQHSEDSMRLNHRDQFYHVLPRDEWWPRDHHQEVESCGLTQRQLLLFFLC